MQKLRNSIKRPNLKEEKTLKEEKRRRGASQDLCNIFNKILTENFTNLNKVLPIQVQEFTMTPNRVDQNRNFPWHIIIKTSTKNKENIEGCEREKNK
jgi:hypothetical protein